MKGYFAGGGDEGDAAMWIVVRVGITGSQRDDCAFENHT